MTYPFIFQEKLQNVDKWHFKMSLPQKKKTRSAGSKPFPADRWKRQNERPGRFDTFIVAIFNGDQYKTPINCDNAQVYVYTYVVRETNFLITLRQPGT
jgi:hypothetical protein